MHIVLRVIVAAKGSSARLFRQNVPCNVPHPQEIPIPSVGGWGGGGAGGGYGYLLELCNAFIGFIPCF